MRLSRLQKHILEKCYLSKGKAMEKVNFYSFYSEKDLGKNKKTIQEVVHKSLDGLVAKDLVVATGRKTAKKWYIQKVSLTAKGRKTGKELIKKRQRRLPIK